MCRQIQCLAGATSWFTGVCLPAETPGPKHIPNPTSSQLHKAGIRFQHMNLGAQAFSLQHSLSCSLSAKGMKFRAGVKMKWGNACEEPQVRLTHLTPRIGASSPADSILQPCILASVPLPGVHLLDAATK